MIVEVLTADTGVGVGVGVIAPAEDASVRNVVRQEIAEPVDAIFRGPGLVAVAVEAMHGNDAARRLWSADRPPSKQAKAGSWKLSRAWTRSKTYSTTGSTPSATISKPWGKSSGAVSVAVEAAAACVVDVSGDGGCAVVDVVDGPSRRRRNGITRDKRDKRDEDIAAGNTKD